MAGKSIGRWTVLEQSKISPWGHTFWLCRCICGTMKDVSGASLRNGQSQSCGCLQKDLASRTHSIDRTGRTYGNWYVVEKDPRPRNRSNIRWMCKCVCGKIISVSGEILAMGRKKACGCLPLPRRTWTDDKLEQLRILANEKLPAKEIGEQLGFSVFAIHGAMSKYNINSQWVRTSPGRYCYTCHIKLNEQNSYRAAKSECRTCAKRAAADVRRRRAELDPTYKERERKRLEEWAAANPEKVKHRHRLRSNRRYREDGSTLSYDSWMNIVDAFDNRCVYCDVEMENDYTMNPRYREMDHFVPMAAGGRSDPTNIVPACRRCNGQKSSREPRRWINDEQRYEFILQTLGDIENEQDR